MAFNNTQDNPEKNLLSMCSECVFLLQRSRSGWKSKEKSEKQAVVRQETWSEFFVWTGSSGHQASHEKQTMDMHEDVQTRVYVHLQ